MTNYDFLSLDDKEFEELALRLLGAQEGVMYERFKPGRDSGIDGRYFTSSGETIVQCKHWARSGLSALVRSLRKDELPKVRNLNPNRYVLVTSLPLSPANKAEIRAIFDPFIQSDSDVVGSEALNDMLTLHPDIERKTIKLWLHSAEVLSQMVSLALIGRSVFILGEMRRKRARYVESASHKLGLLRLTDHHVVLITGEPGVGKTTLAEQLCLDYVLNGFQLCVAARDVEELEAAYQEDAKQVFYFDDFLGRTFLEAIGRHEDSHVVGFIKRIRSDRSKRLVLTSRTTILNRGKSLTDLFQIENVDRHELELQVGNLTPLDKARILHSCIWHSGLAPSHVEEIVRERKYMKVIAHRNFNPRLISFITDPLRLSAVQPCGYWNYITSKLDNPFDIWGDVFDQQMSDTQRVLLLLVVVNGGDIAEIDLVAAFQRYLTSPYAQRIQGDTDYHRNLKILIGSLLNRTLNEKGHSAFELFNPSIADFALPRVAEDGGLLATLALSLKTKQTIRYLSLSIRSGKIPIATANAMGSRFSMHILSTGSEIQNALVEIEMLEIAAQQNPDSYETKSALVCLLSKLQALEDGPTYIAAASPLLRYGVEHGLCNISFIQPFLSGLESDWFDLEDVKELLKLANEMPCESDQALLFDIFKPLALEVLRGIIDEEIRCQSFLDDFLDENDVNEAAEMVRDAIGDLCADIGVEADLSEIDDLSRFVNIDDIIQRNIFRAARDGPFDGMMHNETSGPIEIHDLFLMDIPPAN
jgi:GTPase SAR1 family protein